MISILSLNPSIDKFFTVENLTCGSTNYVRNVRLCAGGKGINSAVAAVKLGAQAELVGFCAFTPGIIEQKLESENVGYELIPAFEEIRENIKITDPASSRITEINQTGCIRNLEAVDNILSLCVDIAHRSSYFIMAGSVPKGCPDSIYREIMMDIASHGLPCRCVIDSSNMPLKLALKARPYMIKPNRQELEQLVGRKLPSLHDVEQAAVSLAGVNAEVVLVSMGCDGALLTTSEHVYYAPALVCTVASEVGAGDSMLAAMVAALDAGMDLLSAFRSSMAASAASVASCDGGLSDMGLYHEFLDQVRIEQR